MGAHLCRRGRMVAAQDRLDDALVRRRGALCVRARRDADDDMAETIAEIYAESGQPTEEDRLWARQVLGLEP